LSPIPWVSREADFGVDARYRVPAAQVLSAFTDPSVTTPDRRELTMASVLRERMPPMEDLIVLGHPRPIGMASVAALVAGGLFLFYRGVGDVRIAILAILAAYGTFALVPVPASINADGAKWTVGLGLIGDWPAAMFPWLASRPQVEWDVALTFIHYELLSGPILFLALYLAPLPSLRPLATKWRLIYAIAIGCAMAVAQRYLGPTWGPHAALVALGAMTPLLDRLTRARPLL
jgi:Na+-translocating ferredoxin:NAD+ oxidoreductase RnfD subunit